MQKLTLITGALCALVAVSGCSGPPDCNATETQELVLQIARDAYIKDVELSKVQEWIDLTKEQMKTLRLETIRLQRQDPQTKTYHCAATLKAGDDSSQDITYTVEETLDQGRAYVTVYGLKLWRH